MNADVQRAWVCLERAVEHLDAGRRAECRAAIGNATLALMRCGAKRPTPGPEPKPLAWSEAKRLGAPGWFPTLGEVVHLAGRGPHRIVADEMVAQHSAQAKAP